MNIRKIIQEEIDDFEWVGDVNTTIQAGTCLQEGDGSQWVVQYVRDNFVTLNGPPTTNEPNGKHNVIIMDYLTNLLDIGTITYCND